MNIGGQFSRYRAIVRQMASDCLAAADLPPSPGSLTLALPAARWLLGQREQAGSIEQSIDDLTTNPNPRLHDSFDHSRAVYHPLAIHLLLLATREHDEPVPPALLDHIGKLDLAPLHPTDPGQTMAATLWHALCVIEANDARAADARAAVEQIIDRPGSENALHERSLDDLLDWWTYHELTGLHALANLAAVTGNDRWQNRVDEIAEYHLLNSQPDNTTTQPWAVFAFLARLETMIFVDQQLHDVITNLKLTGTSAGLVPGLLLADAHAMLEFYH